MGLKKWISADKGVSGALNTIRYKIDWAHVFRAKDHLEDAYYDKTWVQIESPVTMGAWRVLDALRGINVEQ